MLTNTKYYTGRHSATGATFGYAPTLSGDHDLHTEYNRMLGIIQLPFSDANFINGGNAWSAVASAIDSDSDFQSYAPNFRSQVHQLWLSYSDQYNIYKMQGTPQVATFVSFPAIPDKSLNLTQEQIDFLNSIMVQWSLLLDEPITESNYNQLNSFYFMLNDPSVLTSSQLLQLDEEFNDYKIRYMRKEAEVANYQQKFTFALGMPYTLANRNALASLMNEIYHSGFFTTSQFQAMDLRAQGWYTTYQAQVAATIITDNGNGDDVTNGNGLGPAPGETVTDDIITNGDGLGPAPGETPADEVSENGRSTSMQEGTTTAPGEGMSSTQKLQLGALAVLMTFFIYGSSGENPGLL